MTPAPQWSIIIPTYNRWEPLVRTLEAVYRMRLPDGELEVIVVDDGSASACPIETCKESTRLIKQANRGPAAARNRGAREAHGRFIAFLDDDCVPCEEWILKLSIVLQSNPSSLVGGKTLNALRSNPYSESSQRLINIIYKHLNQRNSPLFFASNNMAMSRDEFFLNGGFDENYRRAAGEDRAFCHAWAARGRVLHYVPTAVVHHFHDLNLAGFWRQHLTYGRGAFTFHRQAHLARSRPASRRAFFLDLLFGPLKERPLAPALEQAGLAVLSQIATTVGYGREALDAASRYTTRATSSASHPNGPH